MDLWGYSPCCKEVGSEGLEHLTSRCHAGLMVLESVKLKFIRKAYMEINLQSSYHHAMKINIIISHFEVEKEFSHSLSSSAVYLCHISSKWVYEAKERRKVLNLDHMSLLIPRRIGEMVEYIYIDTGWRWQRWQDIAVFSHCRNNWRSNVC